MTVFFAIAMLFILSFCGLVLDTGLMQLRKLQLQSAADAAALGAALEAERGTGYWRSYGKLDAGINGFTDGVNGVTVTVTTSPTTGAYTGRYDAVLVTITQTVNMFFMKAFNGGQATLSAQAVAVLTPCGYFTGTGTLQSYTLDGYTGSLLGGSCPVDINTKATTNVANISLAGIDIAGSSGSSSFGGTTTFPTPYYNFPTVTDPLSYLTSPSWNGTCAHTGYTLSSGSATLNPGNFCGGMTLTNSTVTLNPGLYIITGGATWSGATVSGTGVTLFFTKGGSYGYSKFTIKSSSTVTLSAPTDSSNGGIPAVLVFTDRNWVASNPQDIALQNSSIIGDGIWYLTGSGIYVWSCTNFNGPHYLGVIADNTYFGGTEFDVSNNYSYVSGGNPMHTRSSLVQ